MLAMESSFAFVSGMLAKEFSLAHCFWHAGQGVLELLALGARSLWASGEV